MKVKLLNRLVSVLTIALSGCGGQSGDAESATARPPDWATVYESLGYGLLSDRPANGFVPDERTAIRIAEAVAATLYGEEGTVQERPFWAHLENGVWTVVGTSPINAYGGTAIIQIRQDDGRIIFADHEE